MYAYKFLRKSYKMADIDRLLSDSGMQYESDFLNL